MAPYPLDGKQVWQLITFIRSLNLAKGRGAINGDPANGARVFAANGCVRCHTAGGAGGFVGPDLSGIGAGAHWPNWNARCSDPNAEVSGLLDAARRGPNPARRSRERG